MESRTYSKIKQILAEGRDSKRHPLEDHSYHSKSEDQLRFIMKDAKEAADAMKDHNPTAETKYLDQVNDAATVLHWRKNNGAPDWYQQKYFKKTNESDSTGLKPSTLQSYMDKALKQSMEAGAEKIAGKESKKKQRWKGIEKANVKFWKKV